MRTLLLALVGGCWTSQSPDTLSNQTQVAPQTPPGWVIDVDGLGPVNATTPATMQGLQAVLPGLVVKRTDLGGGSGIVFEVFDHDEKLFYVVPDDAEDQGGRTAGNYRTTIFGIFATSPRVTVAGHRWRIGSPLTDAKGLELCECWGGGEVTSCFQPGSRVRVIFEEGCEEATIDGGRAMLGKSIRRIMWKAEPEPAEDRD